MDIKCQNCGEPWEQYYLETEGLKYNPEEYNVEKVGNKIVAVYSCPCC